MIYFSFMAIEPGQTKAPDYGLMWRRIIHNSQEGMATQAEKDLLVKRSTVYDLAIAVSRLLRDPTLDLDFEFKNRLIDECNDVSGVLEELGLRKDTFEGGHKEGLTDPAEVVDFAAAQLMGIDFAGIPTRRSVELEIQKHASVIMVMADSNGNRSVVYKVLPQHETPGIKRWKEVEAKLRDVSNLLHFEQLGSPQD